MSFPVHCTGKIFQTLSSPSVVEEAKEKRYSNYYSFLQSGRRYTETLRQKFPTNNFYLPANVFPGNSLHCYSTVARMDRILIHYY